MIYLCFADYLCKYDKELFDDTIFAYKYGQVVDSVYEKYKGYRYKKIKQDEIDIDIDSTKIFEMPSRSKIFSQKILNHIRM